MKSNIRRAVKVLEKCVKNEEEDDDAEDVESDVNESFSASLIERLNRLC